MSNATLTEQIAMVQEADDIVIEIVNNGHGEDLGEVDGNGFYSRVELDEDDQEKIMEILDDDTVYFGAIYFEDNQGFKDVTFYETEAALVAAWQEIENSEERYLDDQEDI